MLKRLEEIETRIAKLKQPERGKALYSWGITQNPSSASWLDNSLHTVFSTPNIFVPAGGVLEAHLNADFDMRMGTSPAIQGGNLGLVVSTFPDVGSNYGGLIVSYSLAAYHARWAGHCMLQANYSSDTTFTLSCEYKNWNYVNAYLHVWQTWTKIQWAVFV